MRWLSLLPLQLCLLWGGCAAPDTDLPTVHEPAKLIYVIGHGWHTSLVIQRVDIAAHLWPEQADFSPATYVEISWGDKDFYQARQPTLGLAIQAAFKSTGSVLHVVGFTLPPAQYFSHSDVFAVRLSPAGFAALSTFIHTTYKRDANGRTMPLGPGWYGDSQFYLAEGRYHLFNTCNNWIARALQVAGAPTHPAAAMTAGTVLSQVRQFGTLLRDSAAPPETRIAPGLPQ
jgi:uncharacterized protein (TIGR02117 family)